MAEFLTNLDIELIDESTWMVTKPLVYQSDIIGKIVVPSGFITDLASVPRVPIVYLSWGSRAHREAVIHDFLYRIGCPINVPRYIADSVFLEAMTCRGKPWHIRYPMYAGVRLGGWACWKKEPIIQGMIS